jgi:hypothetical protein
MPQTELRSGYAFALISIDEPVVTLAAAARNIEEE